MGLKFRAFAMSEFTGSISLPTFVCVNKFRNLSNHWRPNGATVGTSKFKFILCSFKPTTEGSRNQDMFGEFDQFREKPEIDSTVDNGREIVQVKEEKTSRKSEVEEEEDGVGLERVRLRRGRQVMRRSNMLAKQVISVHSALSLGFVSQLWVDTDSWIVLVVEVRPNLFSGESERFLLEDVSKVGDVVLVADETVMENDFKMIGLDTLVGYRVVTPGRRNIGKVRGYTFNINSGAVESLELDSFGISIIPSTVVSTYALLVEDVLEVVSDTVVVHEAASSHIQRLTKGLWDNQNAGTSVDEFGEYSGYERPGNSDPGGSIRRPKSRPKMRETGDDWELPMDYM